RSHKPDSRSHTPPDSRSYTPDSHTRIHRRDSRSHRPDRHKPAATAPRRSTPRRRTRRGPPPHPTPSGPPPGSSCSRRLRRPAARQLRLVSSRLSLVLSFVPVRIVFIPQTHGDQLAPVATISLAYSAFDSGRLRRCPIS